MDEVSGSAGDEIPPSRRRGRSPIEFFSFRLDVIARKDETFDNSCSRKQAEIQETKRRTLADFRRIFGPSCSRNKGTASRSWIATWTGRCPWLKGKVLLTLH
jgi:hypothetical protein